MASDQKALNLLAKGAGITAIALFLSKILTYAFKLILARFLGPEAYGQFSLAVMVMGIATSLSLVSLNSGIKKFIPEYRQRDEFGKVKGVLLSSLSISVPLSILAGLAMFFGAEFIAVTIFENERLIPLIQIMSVGPLFANLKSIFFDTTKAYNIIIYEAAILKVFQSVVKIAVTAVFVFLGFNIIGAAWGAVISTILVALIGLYLVEREIGPILTSDVEASYDFRKLVRYSTPLLLTGMITTVMSWADTALLGYYMTDTEVGFYNVAIPTATLIMLPHQAIGSLGLSTLSELKERNEKAIQSSLQVATYWVYALVFPTFLVLVFFSPQVLKVLWGSQYASAAAATSILAGGYLVNALVGRVGDLLGSEGHTDYILYNNIAAVTLNVGLNILLIPKYGITGAAVATAASTILTNILMFTEVWRKEKIISIPFRKIAKITITGLIPLTLIIGLDRLLFANTPYWFLFPAAILYYSLYIALFLKIIGLGEEERKVILRTGEKIGYREKVEAIMSKIS